MPGKEVITDYEKNKKDIEYWFSIKCEQKYRRFAELLKSKEEEPTWKNIVDLYRYDKRLIFNCHIYLSFLEEYLRASIVRNSLNKDEKYEKWQNEIVGHLKGPIIKLFNKGLFEYKGNDLGQDLELMRLLRNDVCHNHIIIETDYQSSINALYRLLPTKYKEQFMKEMIDSAKNLSVSDKWIIRHKDQI